MLNLHNIKYSHVDRAKSKKISFNLLILLEKVIIQVPMCNRHKRTKAHAFFTLAS